MAFSYSFHISSKSHSISSVAKLQSVDKHNLRKYKTNENEYDKEKIDVMVGKGSIQECVEKVYHREFDEALEKYNAKQKRTDRKIDDYLKYVSDGQNDVAVEIIIQIGDKDFWNGKTAESKNVMYGIFRNQVEELHKAMPDFKIASVVAHYDESSPHLHIVGIPVADGFSRGLERQCSKTRVFTPESLSKIQDIMHKNAEINIEAHPELFQKMQLKKKEKGRNKDIPKSSLDEYYKIQAEIDTSKETLATWQNNMDEWEEEAMEEQGKLITDLANLEQEICYKKDDLNDMKADLGEFERQRDILSVEVEQKKAEKQKLDSDLTAVKSEISRTKSFLDELMLTLNTRAKKAVNDGLISGIDELNALIAEERKKALATKAMDFIKSLGLWDRFEQFAKGRSPERRNDFER